MGMIQGGCRAPLNELCLGFERVCGHELDGRVGDAFGTVFREEYRAVVGATQKAPQGVGAVDDLVFPAHPDFGLGDSPRVCTHERQLAPKVVTKISPRASLYVYNIHTVSEPRDRTARFQPPRAQPAGVQLPRTQPKKRSLARGRMSR